MKYLRILSVLAAAVFLTGCLPVIGSFPQAKITSVLIDKSDRRMYLLSYGIPVKQYVIDLGSNPVGPKRQRGDGKTPEGDYHITHVNTRSAYTLSLGLNYPNAQDIQISKAMGVDPGDDIFIHGLPTGYGGAPPDWTNGCVAVTNDEIREIVSIVKPGTPVKIKP